MNRKYNIYTGLTAFDTISGGLLPGQLITIAGRPAMGKTAFVISLIVNIGVEQQIPVAMFSIEMSNKQIVHRPISNKLGINLLDLDAIESDDNLPKHPNELDKLSDAPIYLDDTPVIGIDEIETKISDLVSDNGVKVVFIDYLQLIQGFEVNPNEIMMRLKAIALNHGICIITISQLYKDFYPLKPYDSDEDEDFFRDATKDIMLNSDLVVLLSRHKYYHLICDSAEPQNIAEAIILKGQNEQIEIAPLTFLPEFARFTDYIVEEADCPIKVVDVIRNKKELEEWQRKIGLI